MGRFACSLVIAFASVGAGGVPAIQLPTPGPAGGVLEAARAAIGSPTARRAVAHLMVQGERTYRTPLGTATGRIVLNFALPDGYLQSLSSLAPLVGQTRAPGTVVTGYLGDKSIARLLNPSPGQGLRQRSEHEDAVLRTSRKRRATQLLVALLLTDSTPIPIQEYVLAGRAEAPSGHKADVVDVRCRDASTFRLFLDASSHRVLMLAPAVPATGDRPGANEYWYFSEFRRTGGLTLPHAVVFEVNGETKEDWNLTSFRVNAPLPEDLVRR